MRLEEQEQYSRRTSLRFHNVRVPTDQKGNIHYGSKAPVVTVTVFKHRNKIGKIFVKAETSL
jgi:hypothetical protein